MGSNVITNQEHFLDEVINKILPSTDKVSFLVGFFYFSGFQQIYKNLKDKQVRILIWMDVEQTIRDLKFKTDSFVWVSVQSTLTTLKDLVNKTDAFESVEALEALEIFVEKIQDGSLEIRQTLEPDHSKMYLFHHSDNFNQWWFLPWTLITGSSNFSVSGLHSRRERNRIMRDANTFTDTLEDFDYIWNNESIPLTEGGDNDQVVKLLKTETWLKLSDPYYCYIRLLSEYFKENRAIINPSDITDGHFQDLKYQTDAIKQALHIIDEHKGVIIADVVGLGKSIIWSTILHNLHEKAIIIAPPHLVDQWNDYRKSFDFDAEVYSSWRIDKALEEDINSIHKAKVILVDEAHKYRNADTIDYWNLHQLCQWKKVILLTATPFNNKPEDIFTLIKLFQSPSRPTLHTRNGLMADFITLQKKYESLKKEYKNNSWGKKDVDKRFKLIADEIKQLIWPIIVRRSRIDLQVIEEYNDDLKRQWYELSKVADPQEMIFSLWDIESLYIDTLDRLTKTDKEGNPINFIGARYNVLGYLINPEIYVDKIEKTLWYKYELLEWRQKNMPFFMRRLLVSRFESSMQAFRDTLQSLIVSIETVEKYIRNYNAVPVIKKGMLPDLEDIEESDSFDYGEKNIESIQEILEKKEALLIPLSDLKDSFLENVKKDKQFLESLLFEWNNIKHDPKLEGFENKLLSLLHQNPDRKIVVFSQYTSTIDYLSKNLKKSFRILKITGSTKTEQIKQTLKENFDAGLETEKQKNEYDILLATDSISEWYNLHRAGIIINYDIPYNPTRVIQRIGRINRINKKVFDMLYIYNYFPTWAGEEQIRTKSIAKLKIQMIATILWIDIKTLTDEEEISSFYKKELDKESNAERDISRDSPYRNDFKNAKIDDPSIMEKIAKVPERTKLQRSEKKSTEWIILFAKKGSNLLFSFYDDKLLETSSLSIEEAFNLFKAGKSEQPKEVSKKFYEKYDKLKKDIQNTNTLQILNTQEKKSLENTKKLFAITKDPYFNLLKQVIEYRMLPLIYMKEIRKITEQNLTSTSKKLKVLISESYLKGIINQINNYDEESQDLIITQEFI